MMEQAISVLMLSSTMFLSLFCLIYYLNHNTWKAIDLIVKDNKELKEKIIDIESTLSFRSRVETFQSRDNWEQCLEQEKRINEKIKESHKNCVQKKCSHQCKKHCEEE